MSETMTAAQYRAYLTDTDEHEFQRQVIDWAHALDTPYALNKLYCNANGQYRPGQRMEPGLSAGVPDLFLPVPRAKFHGLYMELKVGENDLSEAQFNWMIYLHFAGYAVTTCWTFDTATAALLEYIDDPESFVSGL